MKSLSEMLILNVLILMEDRKLPLYISSITLFKSVSEAWLWCLDLAHFVHEEVVTQIFNTGF